MQPFGCVGHRVGVTWEAVYSGSYRRLVALLAAICGSLPEAEEAVQEAFVRALGLTGHRPVIAEPEAWLYRVAVNIVRAKWRRRVLARRVAPLLAGDEAHEPGSENRIVLLAALKQLPFAQREAIVLHYFADLPIEDIAVRVNSPAGTVKARLSRGREALGKHLKEGRHV
jgi:RNA polymerase sigma-70 factor (ECF subfamily)